ncbi:MAG: PspC domain-containing protein [Phototrophicaceae bacterium]
MVRSFSNRIFGGVCGGIASTLPLNAWIWRLIFIVLTLATGGAAAIWYIALWWLLPLESPLRQREGGAVAGFIGVLIGIALLGLWFGRNALDLNLASYWGIALLILAIIFFMKQIITGRTQNIAIGLVATLIPIVALLQQYDVLQAGAIDILLRSAPAILIFLGLTVALRYRMRFGSWIALIVSVALVAGLVSFAFSSRVDVVSTDNQVTTLIPNTEDHDLSAISDTVTTLGLTVNTADTDVTITVSEQARVIEAIFVGSNNSEVIVTYSEDGDVASAQIIERQANDFPLLQDIGRGELIVEIPADIAVFLTFNGGRSELVSLDMGELNLERLSFTVADGDVLVRLPVYQALSPSVVASNGTWNVQAGDLRVIAPLELGTRFAFERATNAEPRGFDELNYQLLLEGSDYVLASRQYDNLDARMQFRVSVSGQFSLETAE